MSNPSKWVDVPWDTPKVSKASLPKRLVAAMTPRDNLRLSTVLTVLLVSVELSSARTMFAEELSVIACVSPFVSAT
jgi:hypothetical protein